MTQTLCPEHFATAVLRPSQIRAKAFGTGGVATAAKHPFLLLVLIPFYVVAWIAMSIFYTLLFLVVGFANGGQGPMSLTGLFALVYLAGIGLWSILLLLHYLVLIKLTLKHVLHPANRTTPKVQQILGAVVIMFAVCHYYVHIFTDNGAYKGIAIVTPPENGWQNRSGVDRFLHVPEVTTAIDFLYFSAVTVSTVGYGDISPKTPLAKLLTIAEIVFGFVLIVIVLAATVGSSEREVSEAQEGKIES